MQPKILGKLTYICICFQCTGGSFCRIQMNEYSLTLDFVLGLEGERMGEAVSRNLHPHTHRHPWKTSSSIIRIV